MLFIDYLPAELKIYKSGWSVFYHVKNPQTGKLHRKEVKVNRVKILSERRKQARKLVTEINQKLYSGWNPFIEQEAPRGFTKLIDALNIYIRTKENELKRHDSIRTYRSHADVLKKYIITVLKKPDIPIISFDAKEVKNYTDYLYNVRNIGGRTFNNYKTFCIMFWNWFVENLYCKINPFLTVRNKMEEPKFRKIIDLETRKRIKDYLTDRQEYEYLTIVLLCFHGLIRPGEICQLIPEYFQIDKKIIFLPAKITKDKDDRVVSLSDELIFLIGKLNIHEIPKNFYVFSEKFKPGKILKNSRDVGRRWSKLRKELNLPAEYQFYSLKDSGIVQKLQDGINPLDIRNQAGHSSLEQTNQYAKYANPEGSEQIKNKSSEF
jgi:integrase